MSSGRLLKFSGNALLQEKPKRIVLSGPSGFVGQRVLVRVDFLEIVKVDI